LAKKRRVEKPKEYTRRQLSHFKRQKRRQRIIFFGGIGIIAAIIVIILLGWYLGEYQPWHRTIIKINDATYDTGYYIDMLEIYGAGNPSQNLNNITTAVTNGIVERELIKQDAAALGIVVNDDDIIKDLKEAGTPVNDVSVDIIRNQRLQERLSDEVFSKQVPVSDNQVYMMAMFVESEAVAEEVRDKVINGDNFTELAKQYGQDYSSKNAPYGDYGWHPEDILQSLVTSSIPIDYAFSAEPGDVSPPLSDNESSKQVGYWLINVLSMSENQEAEVQALFLSSREEALDIRARLEAGDNLTALAGQYSQYSTSRDNGGDMGLVVKGAGDTAAISEAFDAYVFDPETELGKWSDPIKDTEYWTKGGAWVVKVVDKEANRELSDEDRTTLINKAYREYVDQLPLVYASVIDIRGLTDDVMAWMVERAQEELQKQAGG